MTCHNNVLYIVVIVLSLLLVYRLFNSSSSYKKTADESNEYGASPSSDKVSIVLYYAPWCGISVRFIPEWKKLEQKAKQHGVNTQAINCEENDKNTNLCDKKRIDGYPTIHIVKNGKETEYLGTRDADKILEHALQD